MGTVYGFTLILIIGVVLNILRFVFGLPVNLEPDGSCSLIYFVTTSILVSIIGLILLITVPLAIFMGIGYAIEWMIKKKSTNIPNTGLQRQGIKIEYSTESNDSYDYYYSAYQEKLLKDCEKILEEKYKQSWFINGSKYHYRIRTGLKKHKNDVLVYSGNMEPIVINMV